MAQIQVTGLRRASFVRDSGAPEVGECVWTLSARWTAPVAARKEVMHRIPSTTASPICGMSTSNHQTYEEWLYHKIVEIVPRQICFGHHCRSNKRTDSSAEAIGAM